MASRALSTRPGQEKYILTPFYRTVVERSGFGCEEEPNFNYSPYNLHCLKTRLSPTVFNLFGPGIGINIVSTQMGNKMRLVVVVIDGDEELELTEEQTSQMQEAVDEATGTNANLCLLTTPSVPLFDSQNRRIPVGWIRTFLPYVSVPDKYTPQVDQVGLYLDLSAVIGFTDEYYNQITSVLAQLQGMYRQGYVWGAEQIAVQWELEMIDNQGRAYRPRWLDNRFAPNRADFLSNRLSGNKSISIFIGENHVARHHVASLLTSSNISYIFGSTTVQVEVDTLSQAQQIASQIENVVRKAEGKVLTMSVTRASWIYLYATAAIELGMVDSSSDDETCIGYPTNDPTRPLTFSCIVPYGTDLLDLSEKLQRKATDYLTLLSKESVIDKPEVSKSIHQSNISTPFSSEKTKLSPHDYLEGLPDPLTHIQNVITAATAIAA